MTYGSQFRYSKFIPQTIHLELLLNLDAEAILPITMIFNIAFNKVLYKDLFNSSEVNNSALVFR